MTGTRGRLWCPHRPPCPGCPRFGEWGIAAAAQQALDGLAAAHGLPRVEAVTGELTGFRHRARLAIRGRAGSPKVGLFELDTHRVVHIPDCRVQHPLINRVAEVVRGALIDTRTSSYSERAHLGVARYLQVVIERRSQSAQVVLVANSSDIEPLAACLERVQARLGNALHSLWVNFNTEQTNTILGAQFSRWCGEDAVCDSFGGAHVYYPPGAFGQSNPEIAARIIDHVRELIPSGARAAELYAGVGAIGLSVLDRTASLQMNEINPQSLHGLALGVEALDAAQRAKVSVVPGAAADARALIESADVVIVDPPRKGLEPALTGHLAEHPPSRLIYVSCGLESLLRDAERLTARAFSLESIRAFNLIPFTGHVETVACFTRR